MKVTINTNYIPNRIEVNDDCSLGELTEFLSRYYPDFKWKDIRMGPLPEYVVTSASTGTTYTPQYSSPRTWTAGTSHVESIMDDLIKTK